MNKGESEINTPKNKKIDDDPQGLTSETWHRFYVSKEVKNGFVVIDDCIDATIQRLEEYTKKKK